MYIVGLFSFALHDLVHPLLGNAKQLRQAAERLTLLMPAADFSGLVLSQDGVVE
jgi:hypothetical protein